MDKLKALLAYVQGKKTFIVASVTIIFALLGLVLKQMTVDQAFQLISTALLAMGLRVGITQEVKKLTQ